MKGILIPSGIAACSILNPDAAAQMYVSDGAYEAREMKYVNQYPFHSAAYPAGENGRMPYAIEAGLFSEEFMDTDMPFPYMKLSLKAFPTVKGLAFWAEASSLTGEYPEDAIPCWIVGPRFDRLQKEKKFYFLPGIEGRGADVKGVKAYITAISDGGYFADFIPSIGRGTEMVKGRPKLSDKPVFDAYITVGKSFGKERKMWCIGASTDFENGQIRNVSLRYGRNGITAGASYNFGSDMPGIDAGFRTLIDTRTKREKLGLPSKREMRQKYHPRNRLDRRGQ